MKNKFNYLLITNLIDETKKTVKFYNLMSIEMLTYSDNCCR